MSLALLATPPTTDRYTAQRVALQVGQSVEVSAHPAVAECAFGVGALPERAQVVAAGAIIDRSGGQRDLSVPFHALAVVSLPTHQPAACPMCARGEPGVKPGSRR